MKQKLVIIILSIICLLSITLLIYQSFVYVRIPIQLECETEEIEENNTKFKRIMIINVDKEQYVENYQNKDIITYFDNEQYNSAKEITSTDEITYNFNDKTKTVTSEYKKTQIIDSEGNLVYVWYKEYVKNVEDSGYNCKIIR